MEREQIQHQKQAVIEQFGEWTAHNIHLPGDLYTIGNKIVGDEIKLRRITQIVADHAKQPLPDLRVLDLACLEGLYGIELARHGCQVVGIEGRETNLAKAYFTQMVLGLNNLQLVQDDVRHLSVEKYGKFDVVLCLGILYHLEAPDVFSFLEQIGAVCQGFAIIDTHVSFVAERSCVYNGKTYWGSTYREHDANSSPEERAQDLWASLDNVTSFWFTRPSLYNLLSDAGFTSTYECYFPPEPYKQRDRITLLAIKGHRQELQCAPLVNQQPIEDIPEVQPDDLHPPVSPPIAPSPEMSEKVPEIPLGNAASSPLKQWLPAPIKRRLKNLLGS